MATDKIKVAVRVRPFNRRGKYEYAGLHSPHYTDSAAAATYTNQESCENWEILDGKSIVVNMATSREQ